MYIMTSAEGGIFLPFKGEKKHIKHYILWYELFALHRFRGYPDFKVLILFLPESTQGVISIYLQKQILRRVLGCLLLWPAFGVKE